MRNWTATLWPAAFRGVPFEAPSEQEQSGRRLAVHQFPGGETHHVRDMGASAPEIRVSAYVASDDADARERALRVAMNAPGAGLLQLPMAPARQVFARRVTRAFDRDRLGYIAFDLEFVPQGAAGPLASVLQLSQLALEAVGALAGAASARAGGAFAAASLGGFVADAALEALRDIPLALETIRAAAPLDPEISRGLRVTLAALYNAAPESVETLPAYAAATVAASVAAARSLAAAMDASSSAAAFGAALDDRAETPAVEGATAAALAAAADAALARRLDRLTLMAGYVDAFVAVSFASRQAADAARAALVARFEVELEACFGAADADLFDALQDLRAKAIAHIVALIADLRPVVRVRARARLPSIVWRYDLYGDPEGGADLVALNRVPNPVLMPLEFNALAPA